MVNWRRLLLIYKYRNKKKGLSQNIIFKLKTARIPTNLVWYPCRFWRAATLNWKILTDLRQPLFFVSKKTKRRSVYLLPISETATNSATNFLSAYCLYSTRHLDFQNVAVLKAHLSDCIVDGANDRRTGVMCVQGRSSCRSILILGKQIFQCPILLRPISLVRVKGISL